MSVVGLLCQLRGSPEACPPHQGGVHLQPPWMARCHICRCFPSGGQPDDNWHGWFVFSPLASCFLPRVLHCLLYFTFPGEAVSPHDAYLSLWASYVRYCCSVFIQPYISIPRREHIVYPTGSKQKQLPIQNTQALLLCLHV